MGCGGEILGVSRALLVHHIKLVLEFLQPDTGMVAASTDLRVVGFALVGNNDHLAVDVDSVRNVVGSPVPIQLASSTRNSIVVEDSASPDPIPSRNVITRGLFHIAEDTVNYLALVFRRDSRHGNIVGPIMTVDLVS